MKGNEVRLEFYTNKVVKSINDAVSQRMLEATQVVRNETLETLSGARSGKTYRVPGTSRTYTASSPGEPPAVATARLRQSVKSVVRGEGKKVIGEVGTELEYGLMLEYGTRNIAPRPWLRPSFGKAADAVKSILTREWF